VKRWTGAAVVLLLLGWMANQRFQAVRADLSAKQMAIETAWEELARALDERAALVPALLNVSGTPASVEPDLAAGLRNANTPSQKSQAYEDLDAAIARLIEAALRSAGGRPDENLRRILEDLDASANRIAVARRKYNDAIQRYNTAIELFPANVVAAVAGFRRVDAYFPVPPLV
jgi:LemA protein